MCDLARALEQQLPSGQGFVLLVAHFNGPGRLTYVSNIERADVAALLSEMILRLRS